SLVVDAGQRAADALGVPELALASVADRLEARIGAVEAGARDGWLVDEAVAVVVDAVAHFGRAAACPHALDRAAHAGQDADPARPGAAAGVADGRAQVVVGDAVAVVVETVAHLDAGRNRRGGAHDPRAVGLAHPDPHGQAGAGEAVVAGHAELREVL